MLSLAARAARQLELFPDGVRFFDLRLALGLSEERRERNTLSEACRYLVRCGFARAEGGYRDKLYRPGPRQFDSGRWRRALERRAA